MLIPTDIINVLQFKKYTSHLHSTFFSRYLFTQNIQTWIAADKTFVFKGL